LIAGHPGIAYLSQHFELRNNYLVQEVLIMANRMTDEEALRIYDVCRISHLLKRRTDQLSGGEKQRIALARLLVSSPQLLLLDEPYSNLDISHKNILKSVIRDIGEKLEITCILISHDPLDTLSWADEILIMKDGKVIQQGKPQQIYHQPFDEYTAALFGSYNLISPVLANAFNPSGAFVSIQKNLLVRPEYFQTATEETNAISGEVVAVKFFGSYYEVEVVISNSVVTIKTGKANIVKGDQLFVSLNSPQL
jgi:ABC-type sugar transport system ATPase subunit